MWFAADQDGLAEIFGPQALQRRKQTVPAALPVLQQFLPAAEGVYELVVPAASRFLSVRREKVRPARYEISGDMLHDDGDGVRILIQCDVQPCVGHLLDGSVRQTLVGLEGVDDGRQEFDGDFHDVNRRTRTRSRSSGRGRNR
jgi:hypothetical protein